MPAFEAACLFSAQRFFIASDMRLLPAAVMPPLCFFGAAAFVGADTFRDLVTDFALRAAHLAFIASDNRLLPAALMPPFRRLGAPLLAVEFGAATTPAPSSNELIALPIRSRSLFNSERI